MRRLLALALLTGAACACAQETLNVNEPVSREISSRATQTYQIPLNAGDYVAGSIEQSGRTTMSVLNPDGSKLRAFPGPAREGRRSFAFVAERGGEYRLEVTAPQNQPTRYELRVAEILSVDERLKIVAEPAASPRIAALQSQIKAGKANLPAFWKQVAAEHTPLVEPLDGTPPFQLVTFLWRGSAETRNVLVSGSFFGLGEPSRDKPMRRLADTDVWFATVKLPVGARFQYTLSPNDPLADDGPRTPQRFATVQADPLNPNRWRCPAEADRFACQSMVELPGAVPQRWIVKDPTVPAGTVEKQRLRSQILKNERDLSIYLPPGYKPDGGPFALLVVFDESAYLTSVPVPVILDNLIGERKIPVTVAVLISNPGGDARDRELPPNPGFPEFLTTELMPWIHSRYNVTADPRLTVIAGSSLGGLAATYAGLLHPELFGNVLCQSGSFWWAPNHSSLASGASTETGWLAKEFIRSPKLPLKFYLDAGTFEIDTSGSGGSILEPSRQMRDVLLARGYEVHYQQFAGGHDYLSWRGTFADGLLALIGK